MADRITADPAASEYIEAMDPQPEDHGDRWIWKVASPDDMPRVVWMKDRLDVCNALCERFHPYRIGQTVEVVNQCRCGRPAEVVYEWHSGPGYYCTRCCDLDYADPITGILRRIASIRCEQREGQWCWVVGLGEVTSD